MHGVEDACVTETNGEIVMLFRPKWGETSSQWQQIGAHRIGAHPTEKM